MSNPDRQNPLNVLVTDGSYKHALGIVRSLGSGGHRVFVIGTSRFSPGFYSRYANSSMRCPDPLQSPEDFVALLLEVITKWNIQLVIPVGFSSVHACVQNADEIALCGAQSLLPSSPQFEQAADKWSMIKRVKELGISVPESCLPTTWDEARAFFGEHDNRCVVKYRRESMGKGAVLIESEAALLRALPAADPDAFGSLILQEFVSGHGSGYMALAIDGSIVRQFAHRRLREMPPSGGFATAAVSIDDSSIIRDGRRVVESLSWNGPGMVEFRVDGDRCWYIEFNPKFWGSLDLALDCGADFPGDLCCMVHGEELSDRPVPKYRVGRRAWWPWRGDMRRLIRRPGDAGRLIGDLFSPRARSNWRWLDPLPNLLEIGSELTHGLR